MLRKITACLAIVAALGASGAARAQDYPNRVVRFVVAFAPGGPTDVLARIVGERFQQLLGQPFIVESRPGAGGVVGTGSVARSAPDGYTLLLVPSSHAINPSIYANMSYDVVKDFSSVGLIGVAPFVLLANPSLGVSSTAALIELARKSSAPLFYGTPGAGTGNHLAMEMLRQLTGIKVEQVAYASAGPATQALLSGEVTIMVNNMISSLPHIRSGRLIALGLTGSAASPALPGVPVVRDTVPGFEITAWYGIVAPAATPKPVIARLHAAIGRMLESQPFRERLASIGIDATGMEPEAFDRFIADEMKKYAEVARRANIRPQ